MKLLIEKTNNKVSNIVKLEMLSTEFSSVTKLIKENEIPVVVFTDTSESYLINNINELINNARNNTEVSLDIVLEDLISLGGSGGDSRPYKVYTALLTQSGEDAPVATVLENTLGDITFSYEESGWYNVISEGLFIENKTFSVVQNTTQETFGYQTLKRIDNNLLKLNSIGSSEESDVLIDSIIDSSSIEIRVYN
jgi:hypothetical protein